jgi:hypothetical protein
MVLGYAVTLQVCIHLYISQLRPVVIQPGKELMYVNTQNGEALQQYVLLDGWSVSCHVNIPLGRDMPVDNYVVKVILHIL